MSACRPPGRHFHPTRFPRLRTCLVPPSSHFVLTACGITAEVFSPGDHMRCRRVFAVVSIALFTSLLAAQQATPPYKDSRLAIPDRVRDLLSRMTREEKV